MMILTSFVVVRERACVFKEKRPIVAKSSEILASVDKIVCYVFGGKETSKNA